MTVDNICNFIPPQNDYISLYTINFVYETRCPYIDETAFPSVYSMNCVIDGKAIYHTERGEFALEKGDIFFVLPSVSYKIKPDDDFKYVYISYVGERASMIMDSLGIDSAHSVFKNYLDIVPLWYNAVRSEVSTSDMCTEGLLLYTFSRIEENLKKKEPQRDLPYDITRKTKKYIDTNFFDIDFSIEKMSLVLSYNKKYISSVFKKDMKITVRQYLNFVRIQYACSLIDNGNISVKEISNMCGYKDPLYFSKIFKKTLGVTPKEYISQRNNI